MGDSLLLQSAETEDFNQIPGDEDLDDLDAFNDETFGGDAGEWQEAAHEELAQLTEQERQALKASNDFFEFGSEGEEGEALEPGKDGGIEESLLQSDSKSGFSGLSLEETSAPPRPGGVGAQLPGSTGTAPLHGPLTIQTSIPMNQVPVYQQQVVAPQYIQPQQVQYNLVPPMHFTSGGGGSGDSLQDPAIMSFSKVPQLPLIHHALPPQYTHAPQVGTGFPGQVPQQQHMYQHLQQPQQHTQPQFQAYTGNNFPGFPTQPQQPPQNTMPQQQQQQPPTILGFKTIQDVENEMLYGSGGGNVQKPMPGPPSSFVSPPSHGGSGGNFMSPIQSGGGGGGGVRGKPNQPINRNLNYPGMRDRQSQQVYNNMNGRENVKNVESNNHNLPNNRIHDNNRTQAHLDNYQARGNQGNWQNQNQNHRSNQHHNQNFNNHQNHYNQQRNGRRDDDRFGGNDRYNEHHHHHHQRGSGGRYNDEDRYGGGGGGGQRHEQPEVDENSWRWNEVRRNRDSATRKDLMPGHVHVLGILRHSRSRHEPRHQRDPEDDCLGEAEPLINPTGDPLLDAKLEKEQAELASRCRYFDETEDEYAGLMSARDKQFIINIQLSQLKCENPYVDDYYYTMFTAKKEHSENAESTGQMLLSEQSADPENEYIPTQFNNSLGKLQVVTVKAPRQIIDVGVVRCQETSSPTEELVTDPGLTIIKDVKRSTDYKGILLQLERVYATLLEVESLKLKLAAIPTGAPLREQVTMDLTKQVQSLVSGLNKPGLIPLYLQVRKGRGLLSRCLKHLPGAPASRVCQEMLMNLRLMCKEDQWQDTIWIHLNRYLAQTSLSSLEMSMSALCRGKEKNLIGVLSSPLGLSTILAVLNRAATAAKRGQEKIGVPVWRELILKIVAWRAACLKEDEAAAGKNEFGGKSLTTPLHPPQPIDIGFLLTLPEQQMQAWEAFMATVSEDSHQR